MNVISTFSRNTRFELRKGKILFRTARSCYVTVDVNRVYCHCLGLSLKKVCTDGEGGLYQKWTNADMGMGTKLQWTSTNCTILDNYCDVLMPGNMAQKWAKHRWTSGGWVKMPEFCGRLLWTAPMRSRVSVPFGNLSIRTSPCAINRHQQQQLSRRATSWYDVPNDYTASRCRVLRKQQGCCHTFLQTHKHRLPLSGTTRVSRYQKGKTNLDLTEARDSEWQWHQLGHMQVCTALQTDNHASTPPLSFLQARCPSCHPTNSVKALKATQTLTQIATPQYATNFSCPAIPTTHGIRSIAWTARM